MIVCASSKDSDICDKSVLLLWIICAMIVMFLRLFIAALWSPAGKGLTSWLLLVMFHCVFVTFPCGILGQVWYLIVSIPDLCHLSYYDTSYFQHAVDWHGYLLFREQDSTDLLMSVRASSIAMEKASHASIKHLTQSFNKHPLKEPYLQCIIKQMIGKSDQKNFVYRYLLWLCYT